MTPRGRTTWFWLLGGLLLAAPLVQATERSEELAGEQDKTSSAPAGPQVQEPETGPAGQSQQRPLLKLPDVVVKGERQFKVTAERRDLFSEDPMKGTKQTPEDLRQVAIPGLETEKAAPLSDTLTAKNYYFELKASDGMQSRTEDELTFGQEFKQLDYTLHGQYQGGMDPASYGFTPYSGRGKVEADLGFTPTPGMRLGLDLLGRRSTDSQPAAAAAWGTWFDQGWGAAKVLAEWDMDPAVHAMVSGSFGNLDLQGKDAPLTTHGSGIEHQLHAQVELNLSGWSPRDLDLLLEAQWQKQGLVLSSTSLSEDDQEQFLHTSVRGRVRPFHWLHGEVGVVVDDLNGTSVRSAATVVGGVSFLLPDGWTVYGRSEGGLNYKPVSQWIWDQRFPMVAGLPATETLTDQYRAGVRWQNGPDLTADIYWSKQDGRETQYWLDPDQDGVFAWTGVGTTHWQAATAELEWRYTAWLTQTLTYAHQRSTEPLPYFPAQDLRTALDLEWPAASLKLEYHYLGARYGNLTETAPGLGSANLVSAKGDLRLTPVLNLFLNLDNLLDLPWSELPGYPARGFSLLGGLRLLL